jgi:hypothetical protein
MIIADREYMESTVSDKVTELETRQKENQNNLITLLRTVAYYNDKATRLEETWKLSDAVRVSELQDLQSQLLEGSQSEIREEDFQLVPTELHLHYCPYESLPPPVETPEVMKSLETIKEIFPADYPEKYKRVLPFRKRPRTE